ncbi:cytochrome O ubiquinol oxidase subunit IV [Klebsiella pneumoniae]|uniref:cytochrome o ubiquinol oxidase subunit IV n=1 Tax=Klebsiella pneumoniae TaxID=573 RepID=UPI000E2CCAD7|nr:cytochrome o ubiquinol oxidase subunit IV [Klebsiella pneumoniae]SWX47978.1 cytochrome O ubiquinol oxidase subunit IV [Klebsiella pneumoniae]
MNHSVNTEGAAHGSVKSNMTGFLLSVMLTAIPFWLVMGRGTTEGAIPGVVLVCAVVQVMVHLVYFLHLNITSETRWNLVAIVFTAVIIFIVITGSLWIMWNLNRRMV